MLLAEKPVKRVTSFVIAALTWVFCTARELYALYAKSASDKISSISGRCFAPLFLGSSSFDVDFFACIWARPCQGQAPAGWPFGPALTWPSPDADNQSHAFSGKNDQNNLLVVPKPRNPSAKHRHDPIIFFLKRQITQISNSTPNDEEPFSPNDMWEERNIWHSDSSKKVSLKS